MNGEIDKKALNKNIYRILVIGLIIAITLMVVGFLLNMVFNNGPADLNDLGKNVLKPEELYRIVTDHTAPKLPILYYIAIFLLILIPVIILCYSFVFFIKKRNLKVSFIIISVILILAVSVVIGFLK